MKTMALAFLLLVLCAGSAVNAQIVTIEEIQTGLVPQGNLVNPCNVIVTATMYNGFFVAEASGPWHGIWVYTGSAVPHNMVPGDKVCVCGVYKEYYDLSEIDVPAGDLYGYYLKTGTATVPAPTVVAAADLLDPAIAESFESCVVTVADGMEVTTAPNSYGEWTVTALDGTALLFDDYWFDDTSVLPGQCYNNATGIWTYAYGLFRLEPFADGIELTDCTVDLEPTTLDGIKALYR